MICTWNTEQRTGAVVAVRLPDAGAAGHGAAVHGALLAAHPGGAGPARLAAPPAGGRAGLRGAAQTGAHCLVFVLLSLTSLTICYNDGNGVSF